MSIFANFLTDLGSASPQPKPEPRQHRSAYTYLGTIQPVAAWFDMSLMECRICKSKWRGCWLETEHHLGQVSTGRLQHSFEDTLVLECQGS